MQDLPPPELWPDDCELARLFTLQALTFDHVLLCVFILACAFVKLHGVA